MSTSVRIREICAENGISIMELSKITNTNYRTIQNYIAGQRKIGSEFLIALYEKLGVSIDWLLTGQGVMSRYKVRPDTAVQPVAEPIPGSIRDQDFDFTTSDAANDLVDPIEKKSSNADDVLTLKRYDMLSSDLASIDSLLYAANTEEFYISRAWLQSHKLSVDGLVAVTVYGNTMEPFIRDGDVALCDCTRVAIYDGKAYVLRIDDRLLIKYVQVLPGNMLLVSSANKQYGDYRLSLSTFERGVVILGQVVGMISHWH